MKKIILLLFLILLFSGCTLFNSNKSLSNQEINNKLKNGELTCGTSQDCMKLGYICNTEGDEPLCVNKGDLNVTNGAKYEYSGCVCRNSNLEY